MSSPKAAAIELVEREWHLFQDRLDEASEGAFSVSVFAGEAKGWRLRDLVAHIAFWQDLAAQAAERMTREKIKPAPGERLRTFVGDPRGFDEINAEVVDAWRERPLAEVRSEVLRAHVRLAEAIRHCPDELLMNGEAPEDLAGILLTPAVTHLREHREHVDAALKEGATT